MGTATRIVERHAARGASVQRDGGRLDVLVIGGGQAGLSVGYHLARKGVRFLILDADKEIGDAWRRRWDSLHLFTPARFSSLDGMLFPAPPDSFPAKDAMADYLGAYAKRFALPVQSGVKVEQLVKDRCGYLVKAGTVEYEADQVVVATGAYDRPRVPALAAELAPDIVQMHSSAYRSPSQLIEGPVLIVGAGNSGAEVALELSRTHEVFLAGRHPGHVPFRIDSWLALHFLTRLVLRFVFHRLLTIKTPLGRRARPTVIHQGGALIRIKPNDLTAAGVRRVGRVTSVRGGKPIVADGSVLDVRNVIWCTGFQPAFSWIELPIFDGDGEPEHEGGWVPTAPGLYFIGLHFLYAMSSQMIHGVGRDAARIATAIASRVVAAREAVVGSPASAAQRLSPPVS